MKVDFLLDRLMPDVANCRAAAEKLRSEHPNLSPRDLAETAIRSAKVRGMVTGAATGAAATPLTMIPAALADVAAMLRIEATLVGTVAALLEPSILDDPAHLKADILSVVFPAAVSQALRQAGIKVGERLSQAVIRKYAREELLNTITRLVARYVGKHLTRDAVMTKTVPLVGMGIGAGWNWLEIRLIGARAISYYTEEALGPAPGRLHTMLIPTLKQLWPMAKPHLNRLLPDQRQ